MRKLILVFILFLCLRTYSFADTLNEKTAASSPLGTDILYLFRDPFGPTDDRKITVSNFMDISLDTSPTLGGNLDLDGFALSNGGNITVGTGSGSPALIINGDGTTNQKNIIWRNNGSSRWRMSVVGTESGSNAGSDIYFQGYTDAGSLISGSTLYLERSSKRVGVGNLYAGVMDAALQVRSAGTSTNKAFLVEDSSGTDLFYILDNGGVVVGSNSVVVLGASNGGSITFEGTTVDDNETIISVDDPQADRTYLIPDFNADYFAMSDYGTNNLPPDDWYAVWSGGMLSATSISPGGDVGGPASSTDNAIARFDSTTGKIIQNSSVTVNDDGDITTSGDITGVIISAGQFVSTGTADSYWGTTSQAQMLIADYSADTIQMGGATNYLLIDDSGNFDFAGAANHIGGYLSSEFFIKENLAAADDNFPIGTKSYARTITSVGCRCVGTCSTPAQISLEDTGGNAMTHTTPTCATTGTVTYQSVTSGGALTAGEGLAFDVDNAVSPETDTYEILWTETRD